MSGIAIVVVFLLLAGLMIARRLPALLAVPLMALATAAIAGVHDLGAVITLGAVKLAPVYATLFFGALLSRVVLSTGIAETLVTYAAEFGGDRPVVLSLLMCAVVAVLFTTVTGLGAIIMIGTIVLPVMMTVGVPRATSATLFLLAFGLGYVLNIAQWKFYGTVFGVERETFQGFAFAVFALQAVVLIAYALARARATEGYATNVIPPPEDEAPRKRAGPLALITPILPLVLLRGFNVDAIVGFAIAALYGALVTRPRTAVKTLVAAWIRGIEDVAPATILMIGIGMLLVAANLPEVQSAVKPLVAAVAPRTPVAYVVLFGLLSPLALYRGPLNPYGVGIGVYTVLATLHVLPAAALVAAVIAVVQVQNVCDPTNTQNVWVANFTGTRVESITRLLLPWQVAVATVAAILAVVASVSLFGTPLFPPRAVSAATLRRGVNDAALRQTPASAAPARSAPADAGLYAPPSAARTIAVRDDGTADGTVAAHEVSGAVARGWRGFRVVSAPGDPAAADCRAKPYAAVMRMSVTHEGRDGDEVGLELFDCAGWSVNQWYARGARPHGSGRRAAARAHVVARAPRLCGRGVRARARVRSRRPEADVLLRPLQAVGRLHARARAPGRARIPRRPAHRRRDRQARRPLLVGVRHVPNAAPRVRRQAAHLRRRARQSRRPTGPRRSRRTVRGLIRGAAGDNEVRNAPFPACAIVSGCRRSFRYRSRGCSPARMTTSTSNVSSGESFPARVLDIVSLGLV